MKIELVPFSKRHLDGFEPKEPQEDFREWVEMHDELPTEAVGTLVYGNEVLGFLGFHPRNRRTLEVWAMLSVKAKDHGIAIVRTVRRKLEKIPESRLQAVCNASRPDICKWLEVLGFEREGLLRSYGPNGEDRFMYGRVKCLPR